MPSRTTLTLLHKEAKKRVFLQGTVDSITAFGPYKPKYLQVLRGKP